MSKASTLFPGKQVILGGHAIQLKVRSLVLVDSLELLPKFESKVQDTKIAKSLCKSTVKLTTTFLTACEDLIPDCAAANLTKISVETRLQYGRIARLYLSYTHSTKMAGCIQSYGVRDTS